MAIEDRIEHLSFVQSIITRMSDRSFRLKELALTLTIAIFAIVRFDDKVVDSITYLTLIILFWFLDSYYLYIERKYRSKYDKALENCNFDLDLSLNGIGPCARVSKKAL